MEGFNHTEIHTLNKMYPCFGGDILVIPVLLDRYKENTDREEKPILVYDSK